MAEKLRVSIKSSDETGRKVLSLKTKYAVYGAAIAFVLAVAFTAVFVVLLEPRAAALAGNELPRLVVFGAMLVVTLSSLLAFMYGRRLVRSLDRITSSAERISAGDYTQPVATLRRDELGDLERTVEQMRQSLRLERYKDWAYYEQLRIPNIEAAYYNLKIYK